METWLFHALIVMVTYAISTLALEYVLIKHDGCWCVALLTLIAAGALSAILLAYHLYFAPHDHAFGGEMFYSSSWALMVIAGVTNVAANTSYGLAVKHRVGYTGTIAGIFNMHVIIVTLAGAFLYETQWNIENSLGVVLMVLASFLIYK